MSGVNQSEMLVGLDIGTSKVVAVVAEITSEENIEIIGLGTQPSRGLRNGVVVDIENQSTFLNIEAQRRSVFYIHYRINISMS